MVVEEDVRLTIGEGRTCRSRIEVSIDSIRRFFRFKKQYRFQKVFIYIYIFYTKKNSFVQKLVIFRPKQFSFIGNSLFWVKYGKRWTINGVFGTKKVVFVQKIHLLVKNQKTVVIKIKTFLPLAISIAIIMYLINFWNLLFCFFFGGSIFGTGFRRIIRGFTSRKV